QQGCSHAGIHPAAQPQDDALAADLGADLSDGLLHIVVHGPVPRAAADVMDEIAQDLSAPWRMHHFRVKLQAEEFLAAMFDGGIGGVGRDSYRPKASR